MQGSPDNFDHQYPESREARLLDFHGEVGEGDKMAPPLMKGWVECDVLIEEKTESARWEDRSFTLLLTSYQTVSQGAHAAVLKFWPLTVPLHL